MAKKKNPGNEKIEIICKKVSDVKPVCMPFACDNESIGAIPKISPPEKPTVFKRGCESTETIDLSILLRYFHRVETP